MFSDVSVTGDSNNVNLLEKLTYHVKASYKVLIILSILLFNLFIFKSKF